MTSRIVTKKDFSRFVAGLAKQAELWAPMKLKDADGSRFGRVKDAREVCFDYLNTKLPVKELFFPQRELLFTFKTGTRESVQPPQPVAERIVLGVRPCDAAALLLFDRVFMAEPLPADRQPLSAKEDRKSEIVDCRSFVDPYYQQRREKTTLVGLACNEPGPACFCTALAGSPHGSAGLDLLLVDIDERYLAVPTTDKGEKLVTGLPEAKKADEEKAKQLAEAAGKTMKFALDMAGLKSRLDQGFESDAWDELALPCVNCGVCTYVCPTCHCFDVTDEEHKGKGARLRTWDSCQFALFTRHASGHNPRPTGKDRMRQRTLHKFRYFPEAHAGLGHDPDRRHVGSCPAPLMLCVGCGRCIVECPAGIDLRETLCTLEERIKDAVQTAECKVQKAK